MVKFFMQAYDIPTKRDVEKIMSRLDQLERAIASAAGSGRSRNFGVERGPAAETVFDAIKRSRNGLEFADIQTKTGFAEKKIRNIIFRLNKLGKIKRHSRGVYVAQ